MMSKKLFVFAAVPFIAMSLAAQDAAPAAGPPVQVAEKVMKKLKVSGSDPEMPNDLGINMANVNANVFIGMDGKVEKVEPTKCPDALKSIVVDTVKTWKYKPYLVNGQPVEAETTVSIYMTKD